MTYRRIKLPSDPRPAGLLAFLLGLQRPPRPSTFEGILARACPEVLQ